MEDLVGVTQRLHELREAIHLHQHQYYVENRPSISDAEYDALFRELQALETAHPELITPDSPTQRVGGQPAEGFEPVEHLRPMLSLDNAMSTDDLHEFAARLQRSVTRATVHLCGRAEDRRSRCGLALYAWRPDPRCHTG